jgi:hypothetical protein|tara:strand:+ start:260 stop:454 length:195 start_codon:yes stop_codon:yes gene_type:complete
MIAWITTTHRRRENEAQAGNNDAQGNTKKTNMMLEHNPTLNRRHVLNKYLPKPIKEGASWVMSW